jgi:3'(2'), 5'-bisphosphate nucleotidase
MTALPVELATSPWSTRLTAMVSAVRGAGAGLMELRGSIVGDERHGGQLKTAIDLAAEGWVIGFLEGNFENELVLAEERFDRAGAAWPGARTYWTVDALDGTRSYVDGYPGFCVQVAYVEDGIPVVGVIYEPARDIVYLGAHDRGAWALDGDNARRLGGTPLAELVPGTRFVDSTRPSGPAGAIFDRVRGEFVECGSVGLKICRVVEGAADVYAKAFTYKLWDVAPGEVLAREVGARVGTWRGEPIDYAGTRTHYPNVLVTSTRMFPEVVRELDRDHP